MTSRPDNELLAEVDRWVDRNRERLLAQGLKVEVTHGPEDRDKLASWVDIDSASHLVRLIVWERGEANLAVGDVSTGAVLADEHLELSGAFGVEQALREAAAWALGDQPA